MSNVEDSRIRLGTRQVDVQRRNLVQMCRLTVKSLIDKSTFEPVDDNSDELVNFFAVMEQLLLFRMKPQKTWYGTAEPRHYWEYIKVACRKLSNNCITNIESIENIKTNRGKGRAWLRVALMEKRLSDYFSSALSQTRVTKNFYSEGSVMLSEDSGMLCGTLLGLNAIDFSFCLKGDNLEMGPLVIDYTPYLLFQHNDESMSGEEGLSNSNISSSIMSEVDVDEETWSIKYKSLENKLKNISEQKGYLEELVRLRQSQLDEAARQRHHLLDTLEHYETEGMRDRQQLEGVIIELQGQLAAVKDQLQTLQRELDSLRARVLPQPDMGSSKTALAMREMNDEPVLRLPRQLLSSQEIDVQSQDSSEMGSTGNVSQHLLVAGDTRSTLSQSAVKEETQSLVPLAGSFSSEVSFRSGDIQMSTLPKASSGLSNDNEPISKDSDIGTESIVRISVSDLDREESDPLQTEGDNTEEDREVAGSAAQQLKEENGNKVETDSVDQTTSVRDTGVESPEVRSSPDGEVSDEEKTILSAIVGGTAVTETITADEPEVDQSKSGDESFSSDEGRAPPMEMTVDETSSDNSNGEWTVLPRTEESQDRSSSSAEELGIPDETSTPETGADETSAPETGADETSAPETGADNQTQDAEKTA